MYRSRDALFLDNRRDFTKMGQTDFKPTILSMKSVIIKCFNNLFHVSSRRNDALCTFFIFHNLIQQKNLYFESQIVKKSRSRYAKVSEIGITSGIMLKSQNVLI